MKFQQLKNLKYPILLSFVIGVAFVFYMLLIGIPKTRAAGYFNLAEQTKGLGANEKANEYYRKALESYPEKYILDAHEEFQEAR